MISNGNEVIIKEEKVLVKNVKILFIDENSLPDPENVSAVFLVGYFDSQIITARNERGWDIPGGHVNKTDPSLLDALKRETYEESNTIIGNAKPYATIQFEGKDKVMLFYASKDCVLDEFVPKSDSFERKLMTIPEFISKYNWEKDVMKLLIERSLLVLKD